MLPVKPLRASDWLDEIVEITDLDRFGNAAGSISAAATEMRRIAATLSMAWYAALSESSSMLWGSLRRLDDLRHALLLMISWGLGRGLGESL